MRTLLVEPVERSQHQLVLRYRVGELRFTTSYWYDTVDLHQLAACYGEEFMRSVEFHLLAFEANKAASLAPAEIDPGPYADLVTDEFWDLWETVFHGVWGVWRYENDRPGYRLPRPAASPGTARRGQPRTSAVTVDPGDVRTLMLCGGGKDSLTSMRLLERGGIDYDTFVYSHSTYGRGDRQHELIDGLLAHCRHRRLHRGWVIDDAIDSPATTVHPELGLERLIAAETVSSYFTTLPVVLTRGYQHVALGVSRSTDEHNLVWERTGEQINYLWGMSSTAERLLHDYVRDHLVSNVSMFHILRPIYDVNIFNLLNDSLDAVPATHSCAQVKPWCCRCAKCIYVWMNYVAWLPESVVAETFDANLFDIAENRTMLRRMLGLESYKPADCVGTVSEARLAFVMCRDKGVGGVIADDIDLEPLRREVTTTLDRYIPPAPPDRVMPTEIAEAIGPQLGTAANAARHRVAETLSARRTDV